MKLFLCLLFSLTLLTEAQTVTTANEKPSLSKAKEIGRTKSNFLSPKPVKKVTGAPVANLEDFKKIVAPVFKKNCIGCHGPKKVKGKFRIDELNPDLLKGPHINKWLEVYEVLSNSEMPPDDEPDYHLGEVERSKVIDWVGAEMNKASLVRRNEGGHSSFRRMAKYEYNYALQDILGLPYDFVDELPTENTSEDGFKNSSELLQMSAMQFETYRKISLNALKKATVIGPKPKETVFIMNMSKEIEKQLKSAEAAKKKAKGKKYKGPHVFDLSDKKSQGRMHLMSKKLNKGVHFSPSTFAPTKDAVSGKAPPVSPVKLVMKGNETIKMNMANKMPDFGIMRVRIRAGRTHVKPNEYSNLRLSISAQTSNNANFSAVISNKDIPVTATADKPQFVEFHIPMSEIPRNPLRHGGGKGRAINEFLSIQNISNSSAKLHIDYIEIHGPYYESWPPKTHTAIFRESKYKKDEAKYSREILRRFMGKAWRRPVTTQEVEGFAGLFSKYRPQFKTFEGAMLEVLATVLASPDFLYITEREATKGKKEISDMELAMRMAVFLWSSVPDTELLRLAHKGQLKDPKVLAAQTKRMLADSRAQRFSKNFTEQWLGLDKINNVNIDKKVHRSYNADFKNDIMKEPVAFFNEVLKSNNSIIDFIHSDYLVINDKLARHYGIKNVLGSNFRKVAVPENMNRGGILTNSVVLTMNSDGIDSHPLKRGIWLLEHILHDPPPPPPPNVPEVDITDPRILKMTLKERIADHRNKPACRSCHTKIDPWGIAFENYDALGSFRTTDTKRKPVDAKSELFNKEKLDGMIGLKRYLLTERQDQFARALVHKMTGYALGRPLTFSDRADIDKITAKLRKNQDRLGDLVHLITTSSIFHSK